MEIFGIDLASVLFTAAFVAFWGGLLVAFVLFYDNNPYVPRRYYNVPLYNKEGRFIRSCKGWIVTIKKVKWFRIGLKGFPQFKGVEKDIAIMETANSKGEIEIMEAVPDKYDETNYQPVNVPITQKEAFIKEISKSISEDSRAAFEVKIRDAIEKNSRIADLNTSKATKEYISQARREAERAKGDDFITKYGPVISLIVASVFAYLIIDGSVKSYQATMGQQAAVMEHGYSQVIQQCGGVYHSLNEPKNETQPAQQGVSIPFLTK